jgi:hypothetical protein
MLQLSKEQLLKEHFSPTRDRSLFTYKVLMVLIRLCSNKSLMGFLSDNDLKQGRFNAVVL